MREAFVVAGARTPIGAFQGAFKSLSAPQLGAIAIEAVLTRASVTADQVDEVIMGNVISAGLGQAPARQAALAAGLPHHVPAVTVNKVCGSGLKAVMLASQAVRCGDAHTIVAGGMESMTNAPHFSTAPRSGQKLGDFTMQDAMMVDGLICPFNRCAMGNHAEHTARQFGITREDQDAFAVESQRRAAAAIKEGIFRQEIVPVNVETRRESRTVTEDECVRADSSAEGLAKLRPVFEKEGTVTAGNASCISDGAAAVVVMSEQEAGKVDTPYRARIVSAFTSGTAPEDLFIAPVAAVRGVLEKAGLSTDDIDVYEINEAFAAQMLACVRQLEIDHDRVNIYGGGISLGHPIGASGARTLVTLMTAMQNRKARRGVVSLCLGGGNAVAMLLER